MRRPATVVKRPPKNTINSPEDLKNVLNVDGIKIKDPFNRLEAFLNVIPKQNYLLSGVFYECIPEMLHAIYLRDERRKRSEALFKRC